MESQARGGTRWRRFGLVMVPSVAATAAIGVAIGSGALAASLTMSGDQFKVRVASLDGDGFVQYGTTITASGEGDRAVAASSFSHADIVDLCQSVVVDLPVLGEYTLKITAGTDPENPVVAENLFIDVTQLDAQATFTNIEIGVSTGSTGRIRDGEDTDEDSFAQRSDGVYLTDVEQVAYGTSAGSFKLTDLSLSLHRGSEEECF
ncbi:DUF6230 family protein [Streptomyces sp. RFCAC02]|uniref:DUF6230 family protein n=1 Tax=Streptomyces sp. RFCAC02 TaxID=2499143 RepID=UPI0010222024|nr:DUF6230 family protein [Streptomyces sp. RFCAC02]